jgi:AcrR family transcriptional regulator
LATRRKVLSAASELFSADGYSATSISAIGGLSGVRAASIYHAFGSKEGLLAAVVEHAADAFFDTLPDPVAHPGGLWGALADVSDAFAVRPEFLRLLMLLAVERRQGDPEILRTALAVRVRARSWIGEGLMPWLAHLPPAAQREVVGRMSRLVLMLLDGAFIARQLEASVADVRQLFALIVTAGRATLPEVIAQVVAQVTAQVSNYVTEQEREADHD